MTVYRYSLTTISTVVVQNAVAFPVVAGASFPTTFIDVTTPQPLSAANWADLDAAMLALGYTFYKLDPVDTPAQAAAVTNGQGASTVEAVLVKDQTVRQGDPVTAIGSQMQAAPKGFQAGTTVDWTLTGSTEGVVTAVFSIHVGPTGTIEDPAVAEFRPAPTEDVDAAILAIRLVIRSAGAEAAATAAFQWSRNRAPSEVQVGATLPFDTSRAPLCLSLGIQSDGPGVFIGQQCAVRTVNPIKADHT